MWESYPQRIVNDIVQMQPLVSKDVCSIVCSDLNENYQVHVLSLKNIDEIYELLKNCYNHGNTKNIYPKDSISFFLSSSTRSFLFGIRKKHDNQLIAFICGVLRNVCFLEKSMPNVVEVNFLCIHPEHRNKYLTNILINLLWNSFSPFANAAVFYTTSTLPSSFSSIQLFACPINIDILISAQYFELPDSKHHRKRLIHNLHKAYSPQMPSDLYKPTSEGLKIIEHNLKTFSSRKLHFVVDSVFLLKMQQCDSFHQLCTPDLNNYASLLVTIEIRNNVPLRIGHVYLFYTNENTFSFKHSLLNSCKSFCDLLLFPHTFTANFPHPLPCYTTFFHMFQHSTVSVSPSQNLFSCF